MNRRSFIFLTALALTAALTACGSGGQGTADGNAADPPKQEEPAADPVVPGRDDYTVSPPDTTPGQNPAVTDEPDGSVVQDMENMVRNARVHDRDGDLLDGENTVSPGADRW